MKTNIFLYQFETEEKNEKNIFITKYEEINKKLKAINFKNEIHVYDKTTIKKTKETKKIKVNNHINKTGLNPLVNCGKQNIIFYDITNIYEQQKKGHIVECFGNHAPQKNNAQYIQAHFLCLHAIAAHCSGFKKIFAYIID